VTSEVWKWTQVAAGIFGGFLHPNWIVSDASPRLRPVCCMFPITLFSSPNAHASAEHIVAHRAQFNGKRLAIYSIV